MSRKLINLNDDLTRLQNDGYDIEIVAGHLVMNNVPYVGPDRSVKLGRLVSALELSGDRTNQPQDHQVKFCGNLPCDHLGERLSKLINSEAPETLTETLSINFSFSSKPRNRIYSDYHEKMTTYEAALSGYARRLDPKATAKTFRVIENTDKVSPFNYIDTATTRAGISALSQKFSDKSVSIVGLGGTGAYVLDLVAKTPVKEIRIYDGDLFDQHNAFRAPGALSLEELRNREHKVSYFKRVYSKMHRNIVANSFFLTRDNLCQFEETDFTFICIDDGVSKRAIVEKLEEAGTPFVDVGMGLYIVDNYHLGGTLRTTTSTPDTQSHIDEKRRIPFNETNRDNPYNRNIQIADLNMLNAALAVVKWKKLCGFYLDQKHEHHSTYSIDCNHIINEDRYAKTH